MSDPACRQVGTASTNVASIHITQYSLLPTSRPCSHLPVVLLLHGWLGTNSDMSPLAEQLASEGYRILVPDLPLHGQSRESRPSTLLQAAYCLLRALRDFLGAVPGKSQPLAVVGYSLGGRIGLELATALFHDPSPLFQVRSLVLISSAPPPQSQAECRARAEAGKDLAVRLRCVSPSKKALQTWLTDSWYAAPMWGGLQDADAYEPMIKARLEDFDVLQRDAWADAAINMAKYDWPSSSPPTETPVLYIHGELDQKYSACCPRMSSLFTNLSIASVEATGHNVLLQHRALVLPLVKHFLLQVHRSSSCNTTVRIDSVKVKRYSLPLQTPITVKGNMVSYREGILLAISSSATGIRASGVGDICPLPGLHTENLATCMSEIQRFTEILRIQGSSLLQKCCVLEQVETLTVGVSRISRNGITCALLHLLSQAEKCEFSSFLEHLMVLHGTTPACSRQKTVNVNGVLPRCRSYEPVASSFAELEGRFTQFMETSPFEVLKVKVGFMDDAGMEGEIISAAGQGAMHLSRTLRLDANKAWTKQQFREFQDGLGDVAYKIEFIEEPFRKLEDLQSYLVDLKEQSSLSVGLDESLSICDLNRVMQMASSSLCRALIVKPSVIGSLADIFNLKSAAATTDCKVIMSSIFESGVGIAWTTLLAAACQEGVTFHGLGTFEYLSRDVLDPGFKDFCVGRNTCISIEKCHEFQDKAAHLVSLEGKEYLLDPDT